MGQKIESNSCRIFGAEMDHGFRSFVDGDDMVNDTFVGTGQVFFLWLVEVAVVKLYERLRMPYVVYCIHNYNAIAFVGFFNYNVRISF